MSGLPLFHARDDREGSGRQQLLAMHGLRGSVEHCTAASSAAQCEPLALTATPRMRELLELIAALDRRVPRTERSGEAAIASDAAALRMEALQQVAALERRQPSSELP